MYAAVVVPKPRAAAASPSVAPRRSHNGSAQVRFRLTDTALLALFVWVSLPETLLGEVDLFEVPLRFVLFFAACSCAVMSICVRRTPVFESPVLNLAIIGGAAMAAIGLVTGNDPRFWMIDATNYAGLVLGLAWASHRSLPEISTAVAWWATIVSLLLLFNLVGLLVGFVPQAPEGKRLYSYSIFNSTALITALTPFWYFVSSRDGSHSAFSACAKYAAVGGVTLVAMTGLVSATRSMILSTVACGVILFWLQVRGRYATFWILLSAAGLLAAQAALLTTDAWRDATLTERISSTRIGDEDRFVEVQMMLEDLSGGYLTGRGFGSRFESCIRVKGESLAYAPHIGILTLLFKGGLPAFLIGVALPLGWSMAVIIRRRPGETLRRVACAGAVLYAVQSSMSGGWSPDALFLYGVMIAVAWRAAPVAASRPTTSLRRQPA